MAFTALGWSPDERPTGMRIHTYSSTDTQDTVLASGYFDELALSLRVGDKIEGFDSTNSLSYVIRVSAITSGVVTTVNLGGGFETVATTNAIAAGESGKTFFLNLAGGFTSTLPAPALGLKYKFIVKTAPTTAYIIVTTSSANVISGVVSTGEDAAGSVAIAAAADTITFVANKAVAGDYVEVVSDGTSWFLSGACLVQDGITVTQAS